jgi:putative hemolysin
MAKWLLLLGHTGNNRPIPRHSMSVVNTNFNSVLPKLLPLPMPKPVQGALERVLGIRHIERVYSTLCATDNRLPIAEKLLQYLEVTHRAAQRDIDHIPRKGPAVMVVNHPFGILEGAVLATILSRVRSDVKFMANGILTAIPEVRDLLIPVDPMGGGRSTQGNPGGLRKSLRHLEQGGLLVIFPAGEVSHFQWKERSITDPQWSAAIARILEMAGRRTPGLTVVPAYVDGANSVLFQLLGLLHPRLRTAWLARELLNKRQASVEVRVGSGISLDKLLAIPGSEERVAYLRWRTYLLAERKDYKPRTSAPLRGRGSAGPADEAVCPISASVPAEILSAEVNGLAPASLLARSGDLAAYLASAAEIPGVLREIGRLRELTFRAAGEGTGKSTDLDSFDQTYLHLFVWNEKKQEVAGAYRLAATDSAGPQGLYTATLFRYDNAFLDRIGPALELGRSFVRAEYQRSFAPLLLLWKGIGKYVARNPRFKVLFGPVSISNQYHSISRQLMVSFLERDALLKDWAKLVSVRNPFVAARNNELPKAGFDIEDLSDIVSDIEPAQAGVPVLLRQYLKLGGKLLGFNVDPNFSNALDGLILVDLTKTEPKLLERYLGKNEAAEFMAFHKG